ncbi:MAG: hypothetical protein Q9187_006573, partial [Circinaria calcarea]
MTINNGGVGTGYKPWDPIVDYKAPAGIFSDFIDDTYFGDEKVKPFGGSKEIVLSDDEGNLDLVDGMPMDYVMDDEQDGGLARLFTYEDYVCDTETLPLDQFLIRNKDKPVVEDIGQKLQGNEIGIRLVDGSGNTFKKPLVPSDPRLKGSVSGLGYSPFRHGKGKKIFQGVLKDNNPESVPSQAVSSVPKIIQPENEVEDLSFHDSSYWESNMDEAAKDDRGQSKGTDKKPFQKELSDGKNSQAKHKGKSHRKPASEGESSKGSAVDVLPKEPLGIPGTHCYLVRPAREAAVLFQAPYTAATFWELAHQLYPLAFSDVLLVLVKLKANETRPESDVFELRETRSRRADAKLETRLRSIQHEEEIIVVRRFHDIVVRDGRDILSARQWKFVTTGNDPGLDTQTRFNEIVQELLGITTEPIKIQVDRFSDRNGEWLDYSSSMHPNDFIGNIIYKIDDNVINILPCSW